jgi:hypothetical protein
VTIEFQAWPKTPRLFRDIIISEKIDGTNSAIIIEELDYEDPSEFILAHVQRDGKFYAVAAQSRKRLLTPGKTTDNYGFAAWVKLNAETLVKNLGTGRHFGEWWGEGIQGRYGEYTKGRRGFALFNTQRHKDVWLVTQDVTGRAVEVEPVPVFYEGPFSEAIIHDIAKELLANGSVAAPFAPKPEGLMIYHTQSGKAYKFTFDNNDKGKWEYNDVTEVE